MNYPKKRRGAELRRTDGIDDVRDRMAAAALTGLLAMPRMPKSAEQIVSDAWELADMMIDARDHDREEATP